MRTFILSGAALALIAPPVAAQEAYSSQTPESAPLADLTESMSDPDTQREAALMLQAMTEVLLDMPIAPLAQAAAEMAGDGAEKIDPDLTLRQVAPDAGKLSDEIARNTPYAMEALSVMAEGIAAMAPAIKEMTEGLRESFPHED